MWWFVKRLPHPVMERARTDPQRLLLHLAAAAVAR